MDDSLFKPIPDDFVLKPGANMTDKNAYLLFYRRSDTIRNWWVVEGTREGGVDTSQVGVEGDEASGTGLEYSLM